MKAKQKLNHNDEVFKKLNRKSKTVHHKEVPSNKHLHVVRLMITRGKEAGAERPSETLFSNIRFPAPLSLPSGFPFQFYG